MQVALVGGVVVWNVLQNRVLPRWTYVPLNFAGAIGVIALARRLGASDEELGVSSNRLQEGFVLGATAGGAGVAAVMLGRALRPEWFRDARLSGTNPQFETLLRIPVGTALFEEAVFRGALHATVGGTVSNALFGLWHVLPTAETARVNGLPVGPMVAAGTAVTTIAGIAFTWLRRRSGSLAAPVIAHAAVNIAGYLAARRNQ